MGPCAAHRRLPLIVAARRALLSEVATSGGLLIIDWVILGHHCGRHPTPQTQSRTQAPRASRSRQHDKSALPTGTMHHDFGRARRPSHLPPARSTNDRSAAQPAVDSMVRGPQVGSAGMHRKGRCSGAESTGGMCCSCTASAGPPTLGRTPAAHPSLARRDEPNVLRSLGPWQLPGCCRGFYTRVFNTL